MPRFNHETWLEEFRGDLHMTPRWEAFLHITRSLSRKEKGLIIETGCIRFHNDWAAGYSTFIWDWIAKESGKDILVRSVDNNPDHVELAQKLCPNVEVYCMDSITWLRANHELLRECSFLYLDSYDHNPPEALSELHAAGELAASWEFLPSGCIVAVDDCKPDGSGKHFFVKQFFDKMRIKPEITGYVTVWRKP